MTYQLPTTDAEMEHHVRMELARRLLGKNSMAPEISSNVLRQLLATLILSRQGAPEADNQPDLNPLAALDGLPEEEREVLRLAYERNGNA